MNKKNIKWILLFVVSNVIVASLTLFAASNWLFKIDSTPFLTVNDLDRDFDMIVDLQAMNPQIMEKEIKKFRANEDFKKKHLDSIIDDYLIMEECKKHGLVSDRDIKKMILTSGRVMARRLIKDLYIKKVLFKKIKVNKKAVKAIYTNLQKRQDKIKSGKKMRPADLKRFAKHIAKYQQAVRKSLPFTLETLRSKKKIVVNAKYKDNTDEELKDLDLGD